MHKLTRSVISQQFPLINIFIELKWVFIRSTDCSSLWPHCLYDLATFSQSLFHVFPRPPFSDPSHSEGHYGCCNQGGNHGNHHYAGDIDMLVCWQLHKRSRTHICKCRVCMYFTDWYCWRSRFLRISSGQQYSKLRSVNVKFGHKLPPMQALKQKVLARHVGL